MELEEIVKHKDFIELTAEERELVKALASNEEEYDNLKSFLLATEATYAEEKVYASETLKTKVMHELHDSTTQRSAWYSSFFSFLFPERTQFFRVPAVQLAMVGVVIFGFFFWFQSPIEPENLAVNQPVDRIEDKKSEPDKFEENKVERKMDEQIQVQNEIPAQEKSTIIEEPEVLDEVNATRDVVLDMEAPAEAIADEIQEDDFEATYDFDVSTGGNATSNNVTHNSGYFTPTLTSTTDSNDLLKKEVKNPDIELDDNISVKDTEADKGETDANMYQIELTDQNQLVEDKIKINEESVKAIPQQTQAANEVVEVSAGRLGRESKNKTAYTAKPAATKVSIKSTNELLELFYEVK